MKKKSREEKNYSAIYIDYSVMQDMVRNENVIIRVSVETKLAEPNCTATHAYGRHLMCMIVVQVVKSSGQYAQLLLMLHCSRF